MSVRKKILILFNGPHLAYSPTTLQLHEALSKDYDVTIIAQNPNDYSGQHADLKNVYYQNYYNVKGRKWFNFKFNVLSFFSPKAKIFKSYKLNYRDYFFKYKYLKNHLRKHVYDRIIANELPNLFYCSLLNFRSDFLSLELTYQNQLLTGINRNLIDCVIIQSKERYDYLFPDINLASFFIQNAPVYRAVNIPESRTGIVYAGAAVDEFGFYHCLNFLISYPSEQLTLKGALLDHDKEMINTKYFSLIPARRLILNTEYLTESELNAFLLNFEIGLCFYNFDHEIIKAGYYNYVTAPAGKLFKYLASGLPVVCNNIIGFKFVEELRCGVLIDDLGPTSIHDAVTLIRNNYRQYCTNALRAAQIFSFDKSVQGYLSFIKKEMPDQN